MTKNLEVKLKDVKVRFTPELYEKIVELAKLKGISPGEVISYSVDLMNNLYHEKNHAEQRGVNFEVYTKEDDTYFHVDIPFLD